MDTELPSVTISIVLAIFALDSTTRLPTIQTELAIGTGICRVGIGITFGTQTTILAQLDHARLPRQALIIGLTATADTRFRVANLTDPTAGFGSRRIAFCATVLCAIAVGAIRAIRVCRKASCTHSVGTFAIIPAGTANVFVGATNQGPRTVVVGDALDTDTHIFAMEVSVAVG